ncbi:MAG TPA: S8 family serine peptidase, partial [Salinibacter sp.]|nr:S8 family serine peptidase [Salinibacter sp.]
RATDRHWILLEARPGAEPGPNAWTAPVAPSYLSQLREQDIRPVVRSRWLHAVSARLSPSQQRWLQQQSFVRGLRRVDRGRSLGPATPTKPVWTGGDDTSSTDSLRLGPSRASLAQINAVAPMERGLNGRGVRIGFLDAHFRGLRHPAFAPLRRANRLVALRNFTEGRQNGNHGMGVASVTVGKAPGTLVGPAHAAEVLGATTEYTPFERNVEEDYFVAGLEWLYRRGVDVVNVSIGYNTFDEGQEDYSPEDLDGDTALTTRAVDRAAQLGVTVVVSAGNSGCASPDSCWYYVNTPADADSAIAVGAVAPDSTLASFSSRGPTADDRIKPDVVVQGKGVLAAWKNDGFARVGGTSFASPQVTAIVAQMLQVNPSLSPIEVRRLLRQTASQAAAPDNRRGWGVVNADAAIRAAERQARTTPPATLQIEDLYPNPASTSITFSIQAPRTTTPVTLTLHTPLGRPVTTKQVPVRPGPNWVSLNVQSLPSGLYWYRLEEAQTVTSGTVAIE